MSLEDSKGSTSSINYLPPDNPNEGLGFRHTLDVNQIHELNNRVRKVESMCKAAFSIHLSQKEAATMLNSCISPQTTYVMCLSRFTEKQCHWLDILILHTFLPLLIINQSTPRVLVHAPLQFGGMKVVKQSALPD